MSQKHSASPAAFVRGVFFSVIAYVKKTGAAIASTLGLFIDSQPFDAVRDFGADPTGATNSTTALFNFYTACIAGNGKLGFIPGGAYKITRGALAFDNGHVDTDFPFIGTGPGCEFFVDPVTPGPVSDLLAFTNGVAVSGAGKFWKGGRHGDIKLTGLADATGTYVSNAENGLKLIGLQEVRFGLVYGYKLGGSAICTPETLYAATNPDPYHVGLCTFDGIKAEYCAYAINNRNWVGLTNTTIGTLRAIGCREGVIYGPGTTMVIDNISCGTCAGFVVDDGTATASTGGSPSRLSIGLAELDDVEGGFYFNKMSQWEILSARFVHRYNFAATWNPSGGYWPRKVMHLAAGVSPNCAGGNAYFLHRVEAGGALGDLGTFIDCANNANISDVTIKNKILDNAGIGVTGALLAQNVSANGRIKVLNDGIVTEITAWNHCAIFRASTADTVANTGYGTAACKLNFSTVLFDKVGNASAANRWYTVPFTGVYEFEGTIFLALTTAGQRVRLAFFTDNAGALTTQHEEYIYADVSATNQAYKISGRAILTKGHRLFLGGDQNSASATLPLVAPGGASANLTWSVRPVCAE